MKILITGASSRLAGAIVAELGEEHPLRLMDSVPVAVEGDHEFIAGSILNPDDASFAVRDVEVLIHTGELPRDLPQDELARDQMILDLATRGTHVLFSAAIAAGVKKFIYAGTIEIFNAYPDDVYLTELWKPLPSAKPTEMAKYLGELTCQEFARENHITVTCLRLGKLVLAEEVGSQAPDLAWLDLRDAAKAFRGALKRDTSQSMGWIARWAIFHICADFPNPRFLTDRAEGGLGFKPTHKFGAVQT